MNSAMHPVAPEEVMTFLDGQLSADRASSVSAHIEKCAACCEIIDSFRSTSRLLSNWAVPGVSTGSKFEDRVVEDAQTVTKSRTVDFSSGLRRLLSLRLPFAWGAAALVVVIAIMIGFGSRVASNRHKDLSQKAMRNSSVDAAKSESIDDNHYLYDNGTLGKLQERAVPEERAAYRGGLLSGPLIARTVSLSIIVKDFDAGRAALDTILARHNGYAAGLNVSTPQGSARTLRASLRIPAPQLGAALAELKVLGRVEAETQNGEEVTQQHADLVARIKNDRETEIRLQDILRTRTGKVKDVLQVENEIARVRGEIEQMEAEQKTLEHRVDFATIDLKLAEEYKAQLSSPAPSVATQLRNSTINGFRSAFESLLAVVLFLAESGPTLFLWALILGFPAWLLWRRYRRSLALGSAIGA